MPKIQEIQLDKLPQLHDKIIVKTCGNLVQTVRLSRRNDKATILKISKDKYIHLETGEIREFQHKDNRADNAQAVRESLKRLRDYINTNVLDYAKCAWITLTYAENMTDTKRLYSDFDKFIKRLRYAYGDFEYIVAMEPQERGAWHAHFLPIFPDKAPYIPSKDLADIWKQGFVRINALKGDIDNIGAYLTAYLGDMELTDLDQWDGKQRLKKVESNGKKKRIIKGARLKLYPTGFNLYRVSKGIKKPTVETLREKDVAKRLKGCKPVYEKALEITLDDNSTIIVFYQHYNLKKRAPAALPLRRTFGIQERLAV